MTELLWQTIFLLVAAFFFGAVLACGLKRRFYYGPKRAVAVSGSASAPASGPNEAQPKIEVASRPAPEGARFDRALSGQSSATAAPASVEAQTPLVVPPTTVRVETAKQPAPAPAAPQTSAPQAAPVAQAVTPKPEIAGIPRVSVSAGSGAPTKVDEGGAGPSDDLTRIDGVDTSIERRLRELGIRRLSDLAALTAADVKGVSESLHLGGRVERENWVGQAEILAGGGQTYYSRRVDDGIPVPEGADPAAAVAEEAVTASAPVPEPAPQAAPQAPAPEPVMEGIPFVSVSRGSGAPSKVEEGGAGPSEELTHIHGIDEGLQGRMKELGIRRLLDLAGLTASDVKGLGESLGIAGRPVEEKWVAQAQILAEGGETYYSRRLRHGVSMPADADPAARVVAVQPAPAPAAPTPSAAPPPVALQPAAAPAPTPSPAAPAGGDNGPSVSGVSHLRSVRSEAFLGEEGARSPRPSGDGEDLKRIRGIGVLIEKKLNSLGITHYEQIANWTGADIERISRLLDFKGRIERENWIEQARILATGGQTEFSRRGV